MDMDYFYAQIEERDNPSLVGKPVAICMVSAREGSLGAIATCNYAARALGLNAGMPCFQAKRKAPECVFLPARREYYRMASDALMEEARKHCDVLEQVSIDEAYLDVTSRTNFQDVIKHIARIKAAVLERERLTCSVGAGPNKLVAKMASSINKPDGLKIIKPEEVLDFLAPIPVTKLHNVGEKTAQKLRQLGVTTIGSLRTLSIENLNSTFGEARGRMLYDECRGIDDSPVLERLKEQYGRIASLKNDTRDRKELESLSIELNKDVMRMLMNDGRDFRTITVTFILEDMTMKTKSKTLPMPSKDNNVIDEYGRDLISGYLSEYGGKIRRLGVTVSNLTKPSGQKSLGEFMGTNFRTS
jgi:DNA polymerase IV (archaeal DinB-like DNA polymerase)